MPSLSAKPQSFRHVPVVGVRLQLVVKTVGVLLEGHRDIGKPLLTNLLETFLKRHQVVVVLPLNPHDVSSSVLNCHDSLVTAVFPSDYIG